ncbi:MAG: hypothetical protein LZ174_10110 [Thaumarchaeota archaeon]|nr:hypothetical protein [Candidatus Geocrenenecus arthurdayi]
MRKLLLALLIAVALLSVATIAVALSLTPKKIAGSSIVDVSCPAGLCSATVGWRLDTNYDVDACIVSWTPTFTGTATVACIVYDSGSAKLASGSITGEPVTSGTSETNTVPLNTVVDPSQIYKVEVVIMEEM